MSSSWRNHRSSYFATRRPPPDGTCAANAGRHAHRCDGRRPVEILTPLQDKAGKRWRREACAEAYPGKLRLPLHCRVSGGAAPLRRSMAENSPNGARHRLRAACCERRAVARASPPKIGCKPFRVWRRTRGGTACRRCSSRWMPAWRGPGRVATFHDPPPPPPQHANAPWAAKRVRPTPATGAFGA